jgi:hypothetical protein
VVADSFTGSLFGTASWARNALTASYISGFSTNGTQYYLPVWTGASALGTGSLYESGSVLKTVNSGGDRGLKLDFANNVYSLGDQDNSDVFIVDTGAGVYKTQIGGNDIGLKLDFASGDYILGAGVNNSTNIGIYGNSSLRTQGPGGGNEGIQLSTQLYEFGDYDNLSNQTKLTIDDTTQTIALTGSLQVTGSTYLRGLTPSSQTNVLTYDSSSGQVFFTASSAIGGGGSPIATGSFLTTGSLSTTQQLSGSLNITGSLNFFSGSQQQLQIQNGILILSQVSASLNFANDAAAAAGGVPLGGLYRNGNAISIRIV